MEFLRTIGRTVVEMRYVDFWRFPRGVDHPVDISLSPKVYDQYLCTFCMPALRPEVTIPNVQKLVDARDEMNAKALKKTPVYELMENSATYSDMVTWFNVTHITIGNETINFKVVSIVPETEKHVEYLRTVLKDANRDQIDCWRFPRGVGHLVDISLSPEVFDEFYSTLRMLGLRPEVTIPDVQKLIDATDEMNAQALKKTPVQDDFNYGAYHKLDEILEWMETMDEKYKDMVTWFNVTESYEKRGIAGLKISSTKGNTQKPNFWIEGGIHAREWISPATVIYMTGQMLSQYGENKNVTDMVDKFNWYIVPVVNVDGYEYTWDKDRQWRKTRSKNQGSTCMGVDPNRNWDIHWCDKGASKDPCSDSYCGPSAFSEVEVKGVADFIKKEGMKGFIDFHSYSQLWMSPWGYTKDLPEDYEKQIKGSELAVKALEEVYGTKYESGTIANIIYEASGSSADWTYGKANVTYSYGVELRDTGKYKFILPPDQIIPSGKETLQALIALANYVYEN